MKRILFGIGIILFIGIFVLRCDIPMTKNSVVGAYANTNYGNEPCCLETPHISAIRFLKNQKLY
jgi:hypothetical protein